MIIPRAFEGIPRSSQIVPEITYIDRLGALNSKIVPEITQFGCLGALSLQYMSKTGGERVEIENNLAS
jgi:hypothetical protein